MGIQYQQEDTATLTGEVAACNSIPGGNSSLSQNYRAVFGGTPGVGLDVMGNGSAFQDQRTLYFEIVPAPAVVWAAGNWAIRVNSVNGNSGLKWESTQICRLDNTGANIELMGITQLGGAPILMSSGVKTMIVNTIAVPSPGGADRVYIICTMSSTGLGADDIDMTPNQLIDSPFGSRTELSTGRIVMGGLSLTAELSPRERPPRPAGVDALDIEIP